MVAWLKNLPRDCRASPNNPLCATDTCIKNGKCLFYNNTWKAIWVGTRECCCFDNAQRLMVFEYYFVRGKGFRTRLLQFKIRFLYYYRLKKKLRERFEVDNFDILVLLININFYRVGIFSRAILFNYSFQIKRVRFISNSLIMYPGIFTRNLVNSFG